MQHGMHRALQRARQADDRELAGRVRDEGHRLVFLLNGLIRMSRLYQSDNAAFEQPASDAAAVVGGLVGLLGAVHLVCVEDQIYVNDLRLRVRPQEQAAIESLVAELERHNVGGISVHAPLSPSAVQALARALAQQAGETGRTRAALAFQMAGLGDVELTGRYRFRLKGERSPVKRSQGEATRRAASVLKEAMASLGARRLPNPLPVRRAVIDLVETLRDDIGRAASAPLRRRTLGAGDQHLLSVTKLAILLGLAVGLEDSALADLGVAAMLHDVGYSQGTDREGHSSEGLGLLLRQRGFHDGKIRRLRAVLEHHQPFQPVPASLFARIVRIADDYEVLTASRPGHPPGLPPPMAQGAMWAARGSAYDPDLLALFAQTLGAYPPGSLLELSDGRCVVSLSGGRDRERFAWPIVGVVGQADGRPAKPGERIDLFAERERLRPKRVLNPASKGVNIVEALEGAFGAWEAS